MTALADRQLEFCSYFYGPLPMRSSAAIGGNGTQENQCLSVTEGAKDHGSDGALQWRLDRLDGPDGLKAWSASQGLSWSTLKAQALFTMHELEQPQYTALLADLKAGTKSLETLTLNFCDAFERPSAAGRAEKERIQYAHDCLALLMRDAPAPSPAPVPSIPLPSVPQLGSIQVPIELILQLVAPLAESLIKGLLQGALSHAAPVPNVPVPAPSHVPAPAPSIPAFDFAQLAQMIAAELEKLQQAKPAA